MNDTTPSIGEKTELAEDRTALANERTFAGWMRTGFASIGVGMGFGALFRTMEPDWAPKAVATAFLLPGAWIVVAAQRRASAVAKSVRPNYVQVSRPLNLKVIAAITVAATLALVGAIWAAPLQG